MDSFIRIVDRIIFLIKAREENKTRLVNEIIEPLHAEFEKVVAQYFSFFHSVLIDINNKPIEEIVLNLQKQRSYYLQARIKVVSMTESIKEEITNADILELCESIMRFFFIGHEELLPVRHSRGHLLLNHLYNHIEDSVAELEDNSLTPRIVSYINQTLQAMEASWGKISRLNAKLRINYLLSKTIIKSKGQRPIKT